MVRGGTVFDSLANESKQIDLLVTNDFSLKFSYFDRDSHINKTIQTVEGCLTAISVKSTLDKNQLEDALINLASIPPMPESIVQKISPHLQNRETYLLFPRKIVFAFTGLSVETTLKHVKEFYSNQGLKDYQKADLIIVNNCFCLTKIGKGGGKTRDGTHINEGEYHPNYRMETKIPQYDFGALPLIELLKMVQTTVLYSPHVLFDYQEYVNAMDFG